MSSPLLYSEIEVNVRQLAFGGEGVGEVVAAPNNPAALGITSFVPYSVPGERVRVRVREDHERYLKAELVAVLEPAPARTAAFCSVFGLCGGCELQHIDYIEQLKFKREMIQGALRQARVSAEIIDQVQPIYPSNPKNYRRRFTMHLALNGAVGFYRAQTRSVVSIEECPISEEIFQPLLKRLPDFGRAVAGKISSLALETDGTEIYARLKTPENLKHVEASALLKIIGEYFSNAVLVYGERELGGIGKKILKLQLTDEVWMQVPVGGFSQVNWSVNRALISRVQAEALRAKSALDLYAGAGNFALPLAARGLSVTAVETDLSLVALGKQSAAEQGFSGLKYLESSVERYLRGKNPPVVDLIVADPPRSGLQKLTADLPRAERLLYISCHLPSFVRDIKELSKHGWQIESIEPFDMFAQTSYVEILTVLKRP